MFRIRSLLAMALLAIWLPATLHCELEIAGIIPDNADGCCHERGLPAAGDDDADCCIDVESGGYRIDSAILFVAPADWLWAASVLVTPPEPVTAGRLEATAAPLVLRCQWQFFSRAALPARAP